MKVRELFESSTNEKTLIGLRIGEWDEVLTRDTPNTVWPGDFNCCSRKITSLEGAPNEIIGTFTCATNLLTDLLHAPNICHHNVNVAENKITSLDGLHISVNGYFNLYDNKVKTLKDIHKRITKINGGFYAEKNPIESHVLGLLKIPGLSHVSMDNQLVQNILNKYLPNTRGNDAVLECQQDLIDAGLEEFAQL